MERFSEKATDKIHLPGNSHFLTNARKKRDDLEKNMKYEGDTSWSRSPVSFQKERNASPECACGTAPCASFTMI